MARENEAKRVGIGAGETHGFDFELASGEFLHLEIRQLGVDIVARWLDHRGEEVVRVDSTTGVHGSETVLAIASEPGVQRLEVVAPASAAGEYVLTVVDRRPAGRRERRLVAADHRFHAAKALRKEGRTAEAASAFEALLPLWRELDWPLRQAETEEQLCLAWRRQDRRRAVDACEAAVAWFRVLGDRRLAPALHNTGWLYLQLGEPERAIARLEEARARYLERGDERGLGLVLSRLGSAYRDLGQTQGALESFAAALEILDRAGRPRDRASTRNDLGQTLLLLHQPRTAIARHRQAAEIYQQLEDLRGLRRTKRHLAEALLLDADLDAAEEVARSLRDDLEGTDDRRQQALDLFTLGRVRRLRGDAASAAGRFEEVLELARQVGDPGIEAEAATELARIRFESGEPAAALELQDRALELYRAAEDRRGLATARTRSAEILHRLGRSEEAWARLESALADVESIRAETRRQDYRLSYFAARQEYYRIALEVLLELHRRHPDGGWEARAFALEDRRRARELLSRLGSRADLSAVDPALLRRERALEKRLRELADPGRRPAASAAVTELVGELHRVRGELRDASRAGAETAPPIDLEGLGSELLDAETLLLVYSLSAERGHLWSISRQGHARHELPGRRQLTPKVRQFVELVAQTRARAQDRRRKLGRELGDLLLAPVADRPPGRRPPVRRLVIVADEPLGMLPFAALPGPGGEDFLIEHFEIVHLPSISTLASIRRRLEARPAAPAARLAIFADPVFGAADPRLAAPGAGPTVAAASRGTSERLLERTAAELGFDHLERLPGSRREAEALSALAAGDDNLLAIGFAASRQSFLDTDWQDYRILHLATHAALHPEPELSGLILSRFAPDGEPRDGFLPLFEISRLDLPLDLVVLSACQTGIGKEVGGEGALHLVWGFFQAGAAGIVASLWKVDDERTSELMIDFYESLLKEGETVPAALRRAQLRQLQRRGSLPYDWAGFVVHGDWPGPDRIRMKGDGP